MSNVVGREIRSGEPRGLREQEAGRSLTLLLCKRGSGGAFQGHSDPLLLQAEYLVLANVGDGFSIRKDCNGDYLDCWQMF